MTGKLTSRQLMLISHIIASPSNEEACRRAKVSKGTVYSWLKEPEFQAELKRQRSEVTRMSLNRLQLGMTMAVNGLIDLLKTNRPELKRLVCRDILDFSMKAMEIEQIEERLDKIEKSIAEDRVNE